MKILNYLTGVACATIGFGVLAPQAAEAQSWRKTSRSVDLVEKLASLDQYSTLVKAVTEAGLVDALSGIDQATIFAPTNEAFAKIPEENLAAILADKDALTNLLTYHVVPDKRLYSFQLRNRTLSSLNGGSLEISTTRHRSFWWFSSTVRVNDSTVVQANLAAKNGVIHGIDTVLDPDFMAPLSILEIAAGDENFSTLASLVKEAGLARALDSDRLELTVFAPTNEAFEKLPPEVLEAVQNDRSLLRAVLKNHIVRGSVKSTDLETGTVRTVGRGDLDVVVGEDGITVGPATVIAVDNMASNGVVHVINEVLVPEMLESLIGLVESREDLSTFKTVLDVTGYGPFFDRTSRYWKWTFFAPNNDAFAAIPAETLTALLDDKRALRGVLRRHIAFGQITSDQLADGAKVRTLGTRLAVEISDDGVSFNGAPLKEADLKASNGVIHIIGGVLPQDPPANDE